MVLIRPRARPPNGGLQAWLQVFGGFWIYFNTWGLIMTFGVFQTYYESNLISQYTPSSISWIGTIQVFLLIEVGIISGPLYDQGYLRHLITAGALLLSLGFMMASLAKEYYAIFLSLGVCSGIGMGLLFFPGISAFTTYFTTRRGLANGLAASGSGIGAVVYPIVLRQLTYQVSFPWAVRAVGFIIFGTVLIPVLLLKPMFLPQGRRKLFDKSIFEDRVYTLFSLTNLIGWLGVQIPIFYAGPFAHFSLHTTESASFYMLAIIGAGSLPGRLLAPLLGDRFGPLYIYPVFMALAGLVTLAWIRVTTYGGLVAVALLYGFAYGGVVSLPPPAVAAMTRDMRMLGTRIGCVFTFAGVSAMVGPPIAGAIEGVCSWEVWLGCMIER
ncbi:hypothetical protein M406DRAFT_64971 [Cryphonectria parasitica EP155]|uniref:Major facilitator superfamily (MFS) profile domain-containing protein n=1 Tax=Cryphonectria parasitica (strain ATCC 38755 / EP155) TaxID=660469 RepID=A0A9P4XVW9_CRYP1|nr:uncharacterized protein M406DRAFT_64971 [Cryphonectria parasitica EP155]KAF3761888.1 hypothetical protein M406DRAFT_64971 [Cryphonectria parasitica EP155]